MNLHYLNYFKYPKTFNHPIMDYSDSLLLLSFLTYQFTPNLT